jgi:hypothetical protein
MRLRHHHGADLEPAFGAAQRRRQDVVAARGAHGQDPTDPALVRALEQEREFAYFVAPVARAQLPVVLDPERASTDF